MNNKLNKGNYGYVARQEMQHELFPGLSMNNYNKNLCREYNVEIRRVHPNDIIPNPVKISSPTDVYNLLSESKYLDREVFYCLHLNTKNQLLYLEEVSSGVHILSHTFCSHLAMKGAPARAIQELAGHKNLSTTQRYMHLSPAAVEAAIRLLEMPSPAKFFGDILETAIPEISNSAN